MLTSTDIRDLWEPIAEAAGERPEGVVWERDAPGYKISEWCYDESNDGPVILSPARAAALWRDWAVRWLAEHPMVLMPSLRKNAVRIMYPSGGMSDYAKDYSGPTLDHALAAAVRPVLVAEEAGT